MRIAVVHYKAKSYGGGEVVSEIITESLNAERIVFTSVAEMLHPHHRAYLSEMYDAIISTHNKCKLLYHRNHIAYFHHIPKSLYVFKTAQFKPIRRLVDKLVTKRIKHIIVNSELTAQRVKEIYGMDSKILYPPIEVKKYKNKQPEDYFLYIGRLNFEKHIEDMVLACYLNDSKLVVVGDGEHRDYYLKLFEQYEGVVEYRGWVDEKEKIDLLAHCKALVLPTYHEDYGIVFAEAVASGKPIVTNDTCYFAWVIRKHPSVGVSIPWFSDSSVRAVNYAFALSKLERMYADGKVDVSPAMDYVLDISDFKKRIRRIVEEQLNRP